MERPNQRISCGTYLKFEREDLITKTEILNNPDIKDTLRKLHDDFVANNVIVVCKRYYIETLIQEFGLNITNISPNSTYTPSTDSFDEILKSHCKFIESVGLEMSEEDKNLPYLYWTPKLHKVPFKHGLSALLLAPVNIPQKICHACSPKC